MERDPLMTMRQAAEALGLERTAVYRAAYQGRLAVERYGRTMMVRRSEVERYRREKRHAGGRPRRTGGAGRAPVRVSGTLCSISQTSPLRPNRLQAGRCGVPVMPRRAARLRLRRGPLAVAVVAAVVGAGAGVAARRARGGPR